MKILAVDCCLKLTGAALMVDGEIVGHEQGDLGRKQSSELPLMCERLMKSACLSWNELDYVALTNGPGYFTGIRVGASYASGIAYASGAMVIPVSTFSALSYGFFVPPLTLIYAGHGYVYAECENSLKAGEYSHSEILDWLNVHPDTAIISDDPERTGLDVEIMRVKPDMLALCELSAKNINMAVSPSNLKINYYRAPQGVN
ncbi:MAG: tRNA (adenosine(37)-N6)-threonylcarbamoyltransferase complex dimerization subunit type 1 TsaB [Synergistaceae bacterium]|nr:tRNA (adenosine(37)-N6)-threonylcarbamoyltransferase complex dimerization subunit type 1 TsaB [Synergistaceae bacterium]